MILAVKLVKLCYKCVPLHTAEDDDDSPSDATIVKFISYFIKQIQTPFSCWCERCITIEYSIFSMTCKPRRYTLLRHFVCYNILCHHKLKAHVSALVLFFFLLPLENSSFSSQCLWIQNNFTFLLFLIVFEFADRGSCWLEFTTSS